MCVHKQKLLTNAEDNYTKIMNFNPEQKHWKSDIHDTYVCQLWDMYVGLISFKTEFIYDFDKMQRTKKFLKTTHT